MKKNKTTEPPLTLELDKPKRSMHFHYFLIALGIFFLLQDLLAENLKHISSINRIIKSVDEFSSLALFGLVMFTRMARNRLLPSLNINWPLLFFIILLLIPSFIYHIQSFIIISQLIIYVKGFCFLYIFASLNITRPLFYKYLNAFFWVAVIFLIFGLVDFIAPAAFRHLTGNVVYTEYKYGLPAVKSLFIHPALMGWFMSFIALYCFAYFLICKKTNFLWTCLIFSVGCVLSLRVKAIVGLGFSIVCGFFFAPLSPKLKLRIGIVLLPVVIVGFIFTAPVIGGLLQSKVQFYFYSEDTMEIARNILTYRSFQVARDYFPLGAGLGRYGSHLSTLYYSPLYYTYGLSRIWGLSKKDPSFITDTFWPMIIGESGYIGLVLYVLVLLLIFIFMYKEMKTEQDSDRKAFQFGTLLVLIKGVIESIAAATFSAPPICLFIFGAVGICYSLQRTRIYEQQTRLLDSSPSS